MLGFADGWTVEREGSAEGLVDGDMVGPEDGSNDGVKVGNADKVGPEEGSRDGMELGINEG